MMLREGCTLDFVFTHEADFQIIFICQNIHVQEMRDCILFLPKQGNFKLDNIVQIMSKY